MANLGAIQSHVVSLDIIDPGTGKKTGLNVSLRPLDHPTLKRVMQSFETEGLRISKRGKVPDGKERDEAAVAIIIAAIDSWTWGKDDDGEPASVNGDQPDLTPVAVKELIAVFPDFRTQIEEVYEDKRRFFRGIGA